MAWSCTQQGFRGRNNDGSESSATWKAALNTNWSQRTNKVFRIRFLIDFGPVNIGVGTLHPRLQYKLTGGVWTDVTASSSVVRAAASSVVADGVATVKRLGGVRTFVSNIVSTLTGFALALLYTEGTETEVEYSIIILAKGLPNGIRIQFRVVGQGSVGNPFISYPEVPDVTVIKTGTLRWHERFRTNVGNMLR